jgi:choline dehydrogenase
VPFLDHGFTDPPGHGFTLGTVLLQPASTGTITLTSADPAVAPEIDPAYLTNDADVQTLIAGLKVAQQILRSPAIAEHVGAHMRPDHEPADDGEIEGFIRQYAETLYHPVGTCRMGSDDTSVVDGDLRVRGVSGLRVADASVMPRIIRGHTNAPCIMIGEKAADLVAAG